MKSINKSAFNLNSASKVYAKHGGYKKLKAYQVAELCYDFTCRFCDRYIPRKDRHYDQMVQAARSGFQNIAEGSEDSATSKKLEMNLTNVAKSSIGELERDYEKFVTRHKLRLWMMGEPDFEEIRALHPQSVEQAVIWINTHNRKQSAKERAANLGAILANQAHWLIERLLERQANDFEKNGGFSERLYKTRKEYRQRKTD